MIWPDTRLTDLLQIEHPIIQAPMLGACTPELASAVSNAGGLGSLGCAERSVAWIEEQTAAIRQRSNRAFNLNFFVREAPVTPPDVLADTRTRLAPWYTKMGLGDPPETLPELGPGFGPDKLELMRALKPPVISFHFGLPSADAVTALKAMGTKILCTATNVAEAQALEAAGVDAIIAQSWEAGGHRGSFKRTAPWDAVGGMALVPQIVDAVTVPVIAAGGIADGRGIVAALALGAAGVQMGTAFLQTPEAATDAPRRARLAAATETDTMMTDAVSGRAARAVRSRYAVEMADASCGQLPEFLQMYTLSRPILDAAEDDDASFLLYGQSARLSEARPAAETIDHLVKDTKAVMARVSGGSTTQPTDLR